jgi:membrane protease subunit (stomatin/prohibitin family)
MGILDKVREQFIDVIEYVDESNKLLVSKYVRPGNEIKQGAKVIVRESQAAVFLKGGRLADILTAGTHTLNTDNLPVLSTLGAFGFGFNSPIKSDLYFISLRQFVGNEWGTPNPIMLRDSDFGLVRVRAFGKFAFRVTDVSKFMTEIFGTQQKVLTFSIIEYLASIINEAAAVTIAECKVPVIDLAAKYRELAERISDSIAPTANSLGLELSNIVVENISLPEEVEKLIDEQSGIGMASRDMQTFVQYQSVRAMRDAAKQKGGLAGLGVGMGLGRKMAEDISKTEKSTAVKCPSCAALNPENSKFCNKCGARLGKPVCPKCGKELNDDSKFCNNCGAKLE